MSILMMVYVLNTFHLDDQTYQIIIKDVDETLLESMNPDDLAEFFGIESEFVIAMEVI
jgi:predicted HAD superfamily phosphohydrolase YqeG